jgi:nicotinamide mononucleotide transporter
MGTIDVITFVLSIIYILLAIKNNYLCFFVAIVQCTLWTYLDFCKYNLVFDGVLQLFYIVMAFWGILLWYKGGVKKDELPISNLAFNLHVWTILGGVLLAVGLAYGSEFFMDAKLRYLDSITTVLSILATFMLVQRKVDNWIYFIVADALYIYIYLKAGSLMLAIIMLIYTIMAIIGFLTWRKMMSNS